MIMLFVEGIALLSGLASSAKYREVKRAEDCEG